MKINDPRLWITPAGKTCFEQERITTRATRRRRRRLLCEHRTYHFALTTDLLMLRYGCESRCALQGVRCAGMCWSQTVSFGPGFRKMERATKRSQHGGSASISLPLERCLSAHRQGRNHKSHVGNGFSEEFAQSALYSDLRSRFANRFFPLFSLADTDMPIPSFESSTSIYQIHIWREILHHISSYYILYLRITTKVNNKFVCTFILLILQGMDICVKVTFVRSYTF